MRKRKKWRGSSSQDQVGVVLDVPHRPGRDEVLHVHGGQQRHVPFGGAAAAGLEREDAAGLPVRGKERKPQALGGEAARGLGVAAQLDREHGREIVAVVRIHGPVRAVHAVQAADRGHGRVQVQAGHAEGRALAVLPGQGPQALVPAEGLGVGGVVFQQIAALDEHARAREAEGEQHHPGRELRDKPPGPAPREVEPGQAQAEEQAVAQHLLLGGEEPGRGHGADRDEQMRQPRPAAELLQAEAAGQGQAERRGRGPVRGVQAPGQGRPGSRGRHRQREGKRGEQDRGPALPGRPERGQAAEEQGQNRLVAQARAQGRGQAGQDFGPGPLGERVRGGQPGQAADLRGADEHEPEPDREHAGQSPDARGLPRRHEQQGRVQQRQQGQGRVGRDEQAERGKAQGPQQPAQAAAARLEQLAGEDEEQRKEGRAGVACAVAGRVQGEEDPGEQRERRPDPEADREQAEEPVPGQGHRPDPGEQGVDQAERDQGRGQGQGRGRGVRQA